MIISPILLITSAILLIFVQPGTEAQNPFVDLVKQPYYVDKSYLVYEFLQRRNEHNFISYPRQFGKTVNLHLLKTFFQAEVNSSSGDIVPYNETSSYEIFKSSKLFLNYPDVVREHIAQYPVLLLDFKVNITKTMTRVEVLEILNQKIHQAFREYSWMKNVEIEDISDCSTVPELNSLIQGRLTEHELKYAILSFAIMLRQYFRKKVILLVDDYDYAFAQAVCDFNHIHNTSNVIHKYYDLINVMLGYALHDRKNSIDFALLTGTGGKIFTENDPFNTLTYRDFLDDRHHLTPYFGFDKTELEDLLRRYNCTKQEHGSISKYYKGYYTKTRHTLLYNPYSIVKYLQSKKPGKPGVLARYWADRETSEFIRIALGVPEFRQQLVAVVEGRNFIEMQDDTPQKGAIFETFHANILQFGVPVQGADVEDLFKYFFHLGYLSYKAKDATKLYVPNKEITDFLNSKLHNETEAKSDQSDSE